MFWPHIRASLRSPSEVRKVELYRAQNEKSDFLQSRNLRKSRAKAQLPWTDRARRRAEMAFAYAYYGQPDAAEAKLIEILESLPSGIDSRLALQLRAWLELGKPRALLRSMVRAIADDARLSLQKAHRECRGPDCGPNCLHSTIS